MSFSAAMPASLHQQLAGHLLRADGQEDVCLAIYAPSTGATRTSAVLGRAVLPGPGERAVHGNASFTGSYVLRAAREAASAGRGVAALHSHPGGSGWQDMSGSDYDTERSYALLVREITGLPLVGMTVAGDGSWSCRRWDPSGTPEHGESVRVPGSCFRVTWNDRLRPPPAVTGSQVRTVSAWGETAQASLARIRVLVIGAGTVGLDVALRLAATGIVQVGAMDFDTMEIINRDRMIGATTADVRLARSKAEVAGRLMRLAATARNPSVRTHDLSVCEPDGLAAALDYDIIISCVDRPWARGVLNILAYADLVPVLDGGIGIDTFDDGAMRNAVWRTHLVTPGPALPRMQPPARPRPHPGRQARPVRRPQLHPRRRHQHAAQQAERSRTRRQRQRKPPGPIHQPDSGTRRDGKPRPTAVRAVHPHPRAPRNPAQAELPLRDTDSNGRRPRPPDRDPRRRPQSPGRTARPPEPARCPPPPAARRDRRLALRQVTGCPQTVA